MNQYTPHQYFKHDEIYVLGKIGKGYVSKRIQDYSPEAGTPLRERWSHVAACYVHPDTFEQVVTEAHFKTDCVTISFNEWWDNNKDDQVYAFRFPFLHPRELIVYGRERVKYSIKDVFDLKLEADLGIKNKKDDRGVFCSELIAKSCSLYLNEYFNEPSFKIKPEHLHLFANLAKVQLTNLNEELACSRF